MISDMRITLKHKLFQILSFFTFIIACGSSQASSIDLPSGQEILIEEFGEANDKPTLLWLTSERGITPYLKNTLRTISEFEDLHIIVPDWHNSYFLTPTRSSLSKIPADDYQDLLSHYFDQYKNLVVFSTSRSAGLILKNIHQLQTQNKPVPKGIILMAPYLQKRTPDIGKTIEYQQIAKYSNLPLYVMQPERSPRFVPLPRLIKTLEEGGSPVFTQVLKDVSGGFHMRDTADLNKKDLKALDNFPKMISNALALLKTAKAAPLKPLSQYEETVHKRTTNTLKKVSLETPELRLNDIDNKTHQLSDYKGKTVIVSFWASWCRPCIEEMPSLVQLKKENQENIEILAVNIREDKETILRFTKEMGINFPLLQDKESQFTEDWKVYVYPSNYIVDKNGILQYAATGAMDWQDPEIMNTLKTLF